MSLISRKVLTGDEVMKIEHPYAIVIIPGKAPALTYLPDISKIHFNKLNGMGTKEENQQLRINREKHREIREISKIKIWDIWNKYKEEDFFDLGQIRYNFGVMKRKDGNEVKNESDEENF